MSKLALSVSLVFALALSLGGCSKADDEDEWKPKTYTKEVDAARKFFHRDGIVTRALEEYRWAVGKYPTTDQGLIALMKRPKGLRNPSDWKGPYLDGDSLPVDFWENEFKYASPGKDQKYDMWSLGPDGVDGTDDDLLNWNYR